MKSTLKDMVAARANSGAKGSRVRFYKSYIRCIKAVERRKGKDWTMEEVDYMFSYKGKTYIVKENIVGDKTVSCKKEYTTFVY